MNRGHRIHYALLCTSVLAMLLVAPVSWNYFDLHLFMLTWNDQLGTDWNIYPVGNSNYPPLSTYLFIGLEILARRTADNPLVTETGMTVINWVRIVARLPLIVAYAYTGHLLFTRWGWKVSSYWLFTPPLLLSGLLVSIHPIFSVLTIFSGTALVPLNVFLGYQFDLLVVPFTLLALISLQKQRPVRFGAFLAVGVLLKFYPVLLLPLGLRRFDWKAQLKASFVFGCIVLFVVAPFLVDSPYEFYFQLLGFQSQRFPQGLSPFHIPLLLLKYDISQFPTFLKWLWQAIWLPVYGIIVFWSTYRPTDTDDVAAFAAVLVSFVLLNKIGNLNYVIWFWPFLLILLSRGTVTMQRILSLAVTTTLYPLLVYVPAAVAGKPVLIIQKLEWFDARSLLISGFQGTYQTKIRELLQILIEVGESEALVLYENRFWILSLLIAVHAAIQVLILLTLVERLSGRYSVIQLVYIIKENPRGVADDILFSEKTASDHDYPE